MSNIRSAEVLIELEAILQATQAIDHVDVSMPIVALAQELNETAAYATLTQSIPRSKGTSTEIDNYDFSAFILITLNANCQDDKYLINDLIDTTQRAILNDETIWGKLVDRDILSVEYDNAEFYPKRSAILALEVVYRLTCI